MAVTLSAKQHLTKIVFTFVVTITDDTYDKTTVGDGQGTVFNNFI